MQGFEVSLQEFSGPMEKLLQLVNERQLEISRVSLGAVTSDFIAFVERLGEQASSDTLSDFIVVAARLLVLKSKELVPTLELTGEEEEQIGDLEHRLKLYREFSARAGATQQGKNAAQHLLDAWNRKQPLFGRTFLSGVKTEGFFYPSSQVTTPVLHQALESLLRIMEGLAPETRVVAASALVTLQQKMSELVSRLSQQASVTMKGRARPAEKQEVIVMFLAILHLLANRLASVDQADQFGDITVSPAVENS